MFGSSGSSGNDYVPETTATDTTNAISRELWESYLEWGAPIDLKTLDDLNNPEIKQGQVETAGDLARESYQTSRESYERGLDRYHSPLQTGEESDALNKAFDRDSVISEVDAENRAARAYEDTALSQKQGLVNSAQGHRADVQNTLSAWTQYENKTNSINANDDANDARDRSQLWGTGLSLIGNIASSFIK